MPLQRTRKLNVVRRFRAGRSVVAGFIGGLALVALGGCEFLTSTGSRSTSSVTTSQAVPTATPPTPTPVPPGDQASCMGSATNPAPALLLPPTVPQPQAINDLVGVNLQNMGASETGFFVYTFGQIFKKGQVAPSDRLVARVAGVGRQVQMDALALWPDGSVKLASLSMAINVCAGSTLPVLLTKAVASDPVFTSTAQNLANAGLALTVTLSFSNGGYSGLRTLDLGAALAAKLASAPDVWLQGPLATQARVDVPLSGGPLHVTADVTAFADGSLGADVQFHDDLATLLPSGGGSNTQLPAQAALKYTATVRLQGQDFVYPITQSQYTSWHTVLRSAPAPSIHVQHDVAYLEHSGAILSYDLTTGVSDATVRGYAALISGAPLAANGVTAYMPMTGGRADIGYTTQYNTVWLVTQDARAAAAGLAQSDASGAVPWNFKLSNGHWLTPNDDSTVWLYGNTWNDSLRNSADTSVWTPDSAHQPNLNYVPYLMTASRWNLDRLNAQAAFGLISSWPGARCPSDGSACSGYNDIVINGVDQLRAQAWSLRELQEAAFIGKTGSFELTYFNKVVADNWSYATSQRAALTAAQGEAAGWLPAAYGDPGATAEWQQDYFSGVAALGAEMGFSGAADFVAWQRNWLVGRFLASGFNPHDGCTYNLMVFNPATNTKYTTWSAIESATVAAGLSNGTGWSQSDGDYAQLARAALAASLTVQPGNASLQQALNWVNASGAPQLNRAALQADPTFNIVPLQ